MLWSNSDCVSHSFKGTGLI